MQSLKYFAECFKILLRSGAQYGSCRRGPGRFCHTRAEGLHVVNNEEKYLPKNICIFCFFYQFEGKKARVI